MKLTILRVAVFLAVLLSFIPIFNPIEAEAAPSYTISGNQVYTGGQEYFISAEPHTLTASGWVEVTIKTTSYAGQIDLVYGFNSVDNVQPLKQEIWESYEHTLYNNVEVIKTGELVPNKVINLSPKASDLAAYPVVDKSLNTKVAIIEVVNEGKVEQSAFAYDTYDGSKFSYKYRAIEKQPYKQTFEDWNKIEASPTTQNKTYAGSNQYKEIKSQRSIIPETFYRTRVWIDIPFAGTNKVEGKYNIGVKPSNLTLDQAISQNKLWLLDPWYNSSWSYRKSVTVTNASTDYQTLLRVYYGAGTDIDFDDREPDGAGTYTADAGTGATTIVDAALVAPNDYYNGCLVYNSTRALWGTVTDYVLATTTVTTSSIAGQANGDVYYFTNIPAAVYTDSHCQTDFDDIRFTGSNGTSLLDYWLEKKTDSDVAWVWVQNDATPSTTLYFYYGNAGAASVSSGANTFIKFEDFEWGVDTDDLTTSGGSVTWTNTTAVAPNTHLIDTGQDIGDIAGFTGTRSGEFYRANVNDCAAYISSVTASNDIAIRFRARKNNALLWRAFHGSGVNLLYVEWQDDEDIAISDGASAIDTGANCAIDTWELFEFKEFVWATPTVDMFMGKVTTDISDIQIANNADISFASASSANTLQFRADVGDATTLWVDDIIVRKWASVEPTLGTWTAEAGVPTCALAGTITAATIESDIVAGGKTITLTLTGDTWVAAGAPFDAQRQNIINGLTSAQAEAHGWNIEVRAKIPVTDVVRTNATVVTITLSAEAAYDITAQETITVTVPATALTIGTALVAAPTFTVDPIAPVVVTGLCTGFGSTWAVLNGTITSPITGVTQIVFEYGLTTGYGSLISETGTYVSGTNYSLVLTGLNPATVYHYRFGATDGTFGYGADAVFSTHGSATKYDCYDTGGDANGADIYGANWAYQTFTTTTAHTVTEIWLYIQKTGTPGTVTVSLRKTSAGVPTGVDLCTATYAGASFAVTHSWYKFSPTTTVALEASTMYALIVNNISGDGANDLQWRWDAGGGLANGNAGHSTDSGSSWTTDAPADQLFCIWGYPAIEIQDVKVFTGYLETGDWLITARYNLQYPPYYDEYDVKRYFDIQLTDAASTVKASSTIPEWGNRVGSVYLSATTASSLEYGGDYRVRIYGKFSGNPYIEYVLQSTDWLGDDLTRLDSWCITSAAVIGAYYSDIYTTYVAGRGEVLNAEGGTIFSTGIPGLSSVRPDIFQVYSQTGTYTSSEYSQSARQAAAAWQTNIGPDATVAVTRLGNIVGMPGDTMITFFFVVIVFALGLLAFPAGHTVAALALSLMVLLGGLFMGVSWIYIGVIALVAIFLLSKKLWMDT